MLFDREPVVLVVGVIGFGELRRLSLEWHMDIAGVERIHALNWLIKGIFERGYLQTTVALRGASALNKAYFAEYPQVAELDLVAENLDEPTLQREFEGAAQEATHASGMNYSLQSFSATEVRFEYVGPLGRRSAAQPRLPVRIARRKWRVEPTPRPLLHPFRDHCDVTVRALTLEEMAAERIASLGSKPRANDVYDLWFILNIGGTQLNLILTRQLAQQIADEKHLKLRHSLDATHRLLLERSWDRVLEHALLHPSLMQAESEIAARLSEILQ